MEGTHTKSQLISLLTRTNARLVKRQGSTAYYRIGRQYLRVVSDGDKLKVTVEESCAC